MSALAGEKGPTDLAGWLACAADLRLKQATLAAERTHLATRRQMLALAAATGDSRAQKRIEQLAAQWQALDLSTISAAQALEHADLEIAAAEAALAARERTEAVKNHQQQLTARLALVATIEGRLQEIAPLLNALGETTRALTENHLALGGLRSTVPPLAPEAVGGRLSEFMVGLGFADWLPLARPEIRPALVSWIDAEALAQESYGVSS
jgi:hypothetical protein